MHSLASTLNPDVNDILDKIYLGAKNIIQDQFIGMYIHGSLVLGDYDPRRSDIDFLVVTDHELFKENLAALEELHTRMAV